MLTLIDKDGNELFTGTKTQLKKFIRANNLKDHYIKSKIPARHNTNLVPAPSEEDDTFFYQRMWKIDASL
jgi:hypothetical protein